ncbi:MAG: hypothetical protein ACXWMH_02980 [Syntrophales bacterium]
MEKITWKDKSWLQSPLDHTFFMVPTKNVNMNVPTMIPIPVAKN